MILLMSRRGLADNLMIVYVRDGEGLGTADVWADDGISSSVSVLSTEWPSSSAAFLLRDPSQYEQKELHVR